MTNEIKISVEKVVGNALCVASSDGEKLYQHIFEALEANNCVTLSFSGVTLLTSAFLNSAIGRLYDGKFTEEKLRASLKVADIEQDDKLLIKAVTDNAKQYFKDPQKYKQAMKTAEES